ncbi:hypothetical protein N8J89_15905 [Crossiella sp. CA-258035]|uniref:hypothetical protein n=1 Tax=Crossiella sp. CA-258035 TaxID=2981138 RepID=UPI0024BC3191|nr:hypothetical protein [Crossiella sp. CA-258035]WHT22488.1 hypothetical protein N8J89_15905 [Crossiella sp. CA-258035]
MTKTRTITRLAAITLGAAAIVLTPGFAAAAPVQPPTGEATAGTYQLRMVKSEGPTAQFQVTFSKANRLVVADGQLQVRDSADRLVDVVGPRLALGGTELTGEFAVLAADRFSFTVKDGVMPRFTWGGFWCGSAATVSGAVGGALLGGPVRIGFGLGTGIAAAATC